MNGLVVSPHFKKQEFSCKCGCGYIEIVPTLIWILECIREHYSKPVIINSGCRCMAHNRAVGGEQDSRHLVGQAADIVVQDRTPNEVADYCEELIGRGGGVGRYDTFTHIDVRGNYARWDKRTKE